MAQGDGPDADSEPPLEGAWADEVAVAQGDPGAVRRARSRAMPMFIGALGALAVLVGVAMAVSATRSGGAVDFGTISSVAGFLFIGTVFLRVAQRAWPGAS